MCSADIIFVEHGDLQVLVLVPTLLLVQVLYLERQNSYIGTILRLVPFADSVLATLAS